MRAQQQETERKTRKQAKVRVGGRQAQTVDKARVGTQVVRHDTQSNSKPRELREL